MFESFFGLSNKNEQLAHTILNKNIPFYIQLTIDDQKIFRDRVLRFILSKRFYGGQGFLITFEHKVSVSAAAIQITFGLKNYLYERFHTIVLYEDVYTSPNTGALHRGETDPAKGVIMLSWNHFLEGFATTNDRMNLGIHEMAHAFFSSLMREYHEELDSTEEFLNKFIFDSEEEIVKLRQGQKHLFRKYAGENVFEFFAVAVEYFYEDPEDFAREMPELYKFMCVVLNQDAVNKSWRTFKYHNYFKSNQVLTLANLDSEKVKLEIPEFDSKFKLFDLFTIYIIIIIPFLVFLINGIVPIPFIIALVGFTIYTILYKKNVFGKSYLFGDEFFTICQKSSGKLKTYKRIPYSNIISADFHDRFSINYHDNGNLLSENMMITDELILNDIKGFLLSKRIMIKSYGKRLSRISVIRRR